MPPEALARRIAALPDSSASAAAIERLREAAAGQGAEACLDAVLADAGVAAFLGSALGDCPFLLDLAVKDISRLVEILATSPEDRVGRVVADLRAGLVDAKAEAMAALRVAKQDVALTLGLGDLAGAIALETVTQLLTDFADATLAAALGFALAEAKRAGRWTGGNEAQGFFILGMGKYGAGELNYSSDIDIIALFDPEARGLADRSEPSAFWVRIIRQIVTLLQERTADGYVFRIDLRLRPDPAATRVALSSEAALLYYESMGQNWERAALIKARAVAGDIAAGEKFIRELAPFIWRKYLDFAAIADIHSIKRQVHAHRGHATVRVLGHDIKRGRGGIREIEFFAQTQQLIAGGRDPELRGIRTCETLRKLAEKGWIDEAAERELVDAYRTLRNVEHRLQMIRDEQTHTMPSDSDGLARIARLMRYSDAAGFEADLRDTLETVARRYSELFESAEELSTAGGSLVFTGGDDDPDTLETLRRLGFAAPEKVTETVRGWHFGRFVAMRSTAARESLTEITPALLKAFSRAGNPDAAVRAFDSLLQALPAGAQLFALLRNNPELLDLLATILSAAPRLAEIFARRPHVADALLAPRPFGVGGAGEVEEELERSFSEARSYEDVLDRARLFVAERRFLIAVGLLNGTLAPVDAGKAFSDLAEAIVRALLTRTEEEFAHRHGRLPKGRAAVVAFGRLGSREMTAGSDLDLIVAYDHAPDAVSDGERPLAPSQYYARLTQRLTAALAAPTAEGIAYEVDLRLRPSGRKGPLATHLKAFESYQMTEAWTWEHMAMSRGRAIAGDAGLMAQVSDAIDRLVGKERDRGKLAADVASMRARIEREGKAVASPFDVKLARGGLMDCEFAAQFLVLAGLGRVAGETTVEILRRAVEAERVRPDDGERLMLSADLQGALFQILRVSHLEGFSPDSAPEALKQLMLDIADGALRNLGIGAERRGVANFSELEARLVEVQRQTRTALEEVLQVNVG